MLGPFPVKSPIIPSRKRSRIPHNTIIERELISPYLTSLLMCVVLGVVNGQTSPGHSYLLFLSAARQHEGEGDEVPDRDGVQVGRLLRRIPPPADEVVERRGRGEHGSEMKSCFIKTY